MKKTTKWMAVAATAAGLVLGGGSLASAENDIKIGNRSQFSNAGANTMDSSTITGRPQTLVFKVGRFVTSSR